MDCTLDQNTYDLNQFQLREEQNEQLWVETLHEKYEAIVVYAISLLKGETTVQEFEWAFNEYLLDEVEWSRIASIIGDWNTSQVALQDHELLLEITQTALEASSEFLFDITLQDILDEGNFSLVKMVTEVLE